MDLPTEADKLTALQDLTSLCNIAIDDVTAEQANELYLKFFERHRLTIAKLLLC